MTDGFRTAESVMMKETDAMSSSRDTSATKTITIWNGRYISWFRTDKLSLGVIVALAADSPFFSYDREFAAKTGRHCQRVSKRLFLRCLNTKLAGTLVRLRLQVIRFNSRKALSVRASEPLSRRHLKRSHT